MSTASQIALEKPVPLRIPRSFYRPELDSLRFFAAFAVFLHHAANMFNDTPQTSLPGKVFADVTHSGAFGVNLFFVLSAFLITTLLFKERDQTGTIHIKAFYVRRVLRIWPLYFFFIAFAYGLTHAGLFRQQLSNSYVLAMLLLSGNWAFARLGPPRSVANPLWSISLEEQFYLFWPNIAKRFGSRAIAWLALGMILAGALVRGIIAWPSYHSQFLWFNSFAHLDAFSLGILLAVFLYRSEWRISAGKRVLFALAGVAIWIAVAQWADISRGDVVAFLPGLLGYPSVALGSLLLLLSVYGVNRDSWLANPVFAYLGKISYGIYVYHDLSLALCHRLLTENELISGLAAFPVTLVFAALSYRFLEAPFLQFKEKFALVKSRPV